MAETAKDLESEVLQLPAAARARLAERLLASLDTEADPQNEELWLAEAERRLNELESGLAKGVPADQVIADVRSKLR
jgi:putative addiction module component (TIGR02574 family)